MKLLALVVLFAMLTFAAMLAADNTTTTTNYVALAKLYELEAAFHGAVSSHSTTGDSQEVIDQRIREVLSLWEEEGSLDLESATYAVNGKYIGRGNLDDPSTCPKPSGNPDNQGTLCTLYQYVSGSFQPGSTLIVLAPPYLTHFQVDGSVASVHFECHYFDIATDPTTGLPLWTPGAHIAFNGFARESNGRWYLWKATATKVAGAPIA